MSERRKNTQDRRHHSELASNERTQSNRRHHDDRRLANRSSHPPKGSEEWRLGGRYAKECVLLEKLPTLHPEAWTWGDYTGRHCVVGPFSSLERAKAFSQQPQQQHDYESYFFQLRTVREHWFVEVSPDGQTKLVSSPELASEVVYEGVL
jgi:hypothetical protein